MIWKQIMKKEMKNKVILKSKKDDNKDIIMIQNKINENNIENDADNNEDILEILEDKVEDNFIH